jgi:hypothetical protein
VDGTVTIENEVILPSLEVTGTGGIINAMDNDFSFAYSDDTLQSAVLTVFSASPMALETSVSCDCSTPNLADITADTIIGGVDPITGALKGMEVLEPVPTDTGIIPAQFLAPGWAHIDTVCAAGIEGIKRRQ